VNRKTLLLLAVSLLTITSGCADPDLDELRSRMASMESEARGRVPSLPTLNEPELPAFNADGRNPMNRPGGAAPAAPAATPQGPRPDSGRQPHPLEDYSLESLRLVGTMGSEQRLIALVEGPRGRLHSVAEGDYMGRNHGRVERITADAIELRELVEAGRGWQERTTTVTRDDQES
jgi:type IV pilus assembly protein PilP